MGNRDIKDLREYFQFGTQKIESIEQLLTRISSLSFLAYNLQAILIEFKMNLNLR